MLEVQRLSKSYGAGTKVTQAIGDISFSVDEHEFLCVVGPSGCGKTTLLKCMAGLIAPTGGRTVLRDAVVTSPPAEMAAVFQDYNRSLFPWLNVSRNVEIPLRHKIKQKAKRHELVAEALSAVGLTGFAHHYPWQLSGGMQQRVAIARAVAYQPRVLLMDEPFASVDAQTRADLEDLVLRIRDELGVTIVLVTHDIDEAVYMGDRVVILTSPPSRVQEVLTVTLPQPRDQVDTKELADFAHFRAHVYRAIKRAPARPLALAPESPRAAAPRATGGL